MEPRISNWRDATQARLDNLRCPKCRAVNRTGAHVIEVEKEHAYCSVCAHDWELIEGD